MPDRDFRRDAPEIALHHNGIIHIIFDEQDAHRTVPLEAGHKTEPLQNSFRMILKLQNQSFKSATCFLPETLPRRVDGSAGMPGVGISKVLAP